MKIATGFVALLALAALVSSSPARAGHPPGKHPRTAWHPLVEKSSAKDWRGWKSADFPAGWSVADGVISKDGDVDDLVTRNEFANFELELEWKIGTGGNAGIFYRGTREYDHIYWSAPEYQLLDDANAPDGKNRLTSAAAAYALYAAPAGVVHAAGEWNATRLVVNGAHVEHWLNGQQIVAYELWTDEWKRMVAQSKFKDHPRYAMARRGAIGIQDHGDWIAFRAIRIRELG
jgi:hypothetical protein